jgi:hypothetical protein
MHHFAFCKNPLRPLTEWKGNDGRFYCSEFCADAGDTPENVHYIETGRDGLQSRSPAPTLKFVFRVRTKSDYVRMVSSFLLQVHASGARWSKQK